MPEANPAPILSKLVSQSLQVKPGAARKPKLSYRLRDALRLRHFLTAHLLADGYDILTGQELSGHSDVKTTVIYTHVLTNESIIDQIYFSKISSHPSFPKRGIPPFIKGRRGGI